MSTWAKIKLALLIIGLIGNLVQGQGDDQQAADKINSAFGKEGDESVTAEDVNGLRWLINLFK